MRLLRLVLLLLLLLQTSCSNSDEANRKEETAQEKIGREAAEQIQSTLQRAENAGKLQEQHNLEIEEAVKKNSSEK